MNEKLGWWVMVAMVLVGCDAPKPEATAALATEEPTMNQAPTPVPTAGAVTQPAPPGPSAAAVKPSTKIVAPDMVQKPNKIVAPDMVQKPGKAAKPAAMPLPSP